MDREDALIDNSFFSILMVGPAVVERCSLLTLATLEGLRSNS